VVGVLLRLDEDVPEDLCGRVVAEVLDEFHVVAQRLDDVAVDLHVVFQRRPDVVDVLVFGLDRGELLEVVHACDWRPAECLGALGDLVGGRLGVLGRLAEEQVEVAELRALDVPVVLSELVVEDVGVGQVRVQRVDDLFGLLLVDA